jgi:hypothetical protein
MHVERGPKQTKTTVVLFGKPQQQKVLRTHYITHNNNPQTIYKTHVTCESFWMEPCVTIRSKLETRRESSIHC